MCIGQVRVGSGRGRVGLGSGWVRVRVEILEPVSRPNKFGLGVRVRVGSGWNRKSENNVVIL